MTRKYGAVFLIAVGLAFFGLKSTIGQTVPDNHVRQVQAEADRLMSGKRSKVVVKLKDGTRKKGYIALIGEHTFDLSDDAGHITTIDYGEVEKIKKDGLSKGAKTAVWIGVAAGVVVLILTAKRPGIGPICPLGCGPF